MKFKNIVILFCLASLFILSSCNKEICYECTGTISGLENIQNICSDGDDLTISSSVGGQANTTLTTGSIDDYVTNLRNSGYTCNEK